MRLALSIGRGNRVTRYLEGSTLKEALIILAVLVVLMGLFLPILSKAKRKSARITCVSRLCNIGLSFRVFATDHTGFFPMQFSTNTSGTLEFFESGEVYHHFQVLSNELSTPIILICPTDAAQGRPYATRFDAGFADENLSYFVGVDAQESLPNSILSGDRNVEGSIYIGKRIFHFTSSTLVHWGENFHANCGNVILGDGSCRQMSNADLCSLFSLSGNPTNRLAIPK